MVGGEAMIRKILEWHIHKYTELDIYMPKKIGETYGFLYRCEVCGKTKLTKNRGITKVEHIFMDKNHYSEYIKNFK